MTLETLFNLDPKIWPLACMAFLRIVSVFVWLPIFGDQAVPTRLRIALSIAFVFFLWPVIGTQVHTNEPLLQWSPLTLGLATLREVFFGFATGFVARTIIYAASIGSHLIGINMGFQTASLFSPTLGENESSFSTFKGWIVLLLILVFNIHHHFLKGLAESFSAVAIAPSGDAGTIFKMALEAVKASFTLGLRLAAPILVVQILVTLSLGLLNRALPQLNVLIINFPVSFLLSMVILFFSTAAFVRFVGGVGVTREVNAMNMMQKAFSTSTIEQKPEQ